MTRRPPRVVLFDVDGTLIDSNDAHAHAWVDALEEFGFDVPFERVRPLVGMGGDRVIRGLTGVAHNEDHGRAIGERRGEIFTTRYLPTLKPFPRARELVLRVRAAGLRAVVATSSRAEDLRALLAVARVEELFESAATASDAAHSKPAPAIVRAAVQQSGHRAEQCIMIGDTPYDVEAATAARVPIVALRCGGWSDSELDGSLAIYNDPAQLLSKFADSPLGSGEG